MSLQTTPESNRFQIGIFGHRNVGKSSLLNALAGQDLSITSDVAGTTTDVVKKAMELLPLGPILWIDTPGMDDVGELGDQRVQRAKQWISKVDFALLVTVQPDTLLPEEQKILEALSQQNVPTWILHNKRDLLQQVPENKADEFWISTQNPKDIYQLKNHLSQIKIFSPSSLLEGLVSPKDLVVLVTPIDSGAPKGRMILPQQQVLREILDFHAISMVVQVEELENLLPLVGDKIKLVITDSQVFKAVDKLVPSQIPLTSFSILFARNKGILDTAVQGVRSLNSLQDGDKILICEGCTHHRQCDDIGTVKLPNWISQRTKKNLQFVFTSGGDFPEDLSPYRLIIHCGGCMLNEKTVRSRMELAMEQQIPFTNYGIAIADINDILQRSIEIFPHLKNL